ncbi:MAG: hypothetical protein GPOALKHO_001264 [Sodalis sp.]|nr:MAG: hypothetical protein GPOALKHO_001264 [Sodalis sp.]
MTLHGGEVVTLLGKLSTSATENIILRYRHSISDSFIRLLSADGMRIAGYAERVIVLRDRRRVAELACQQILVAGIMQAITA